MGSSLKFSFKSKVKERTRVGPRKCWGGHTFLWFTLQFMYLCQVHHWFWGPVVLKTKVSFLSVYCHCSSQHGCTFIPSRQQLVIFPPFYEFGDPPIFSTSAMLPSVNQGKTLGYKSLSRDLLSAQVSESAAAGAILPLVLVTPVVRENTRMGCLNSSSARHSGLLCLCFMETVGSCPAVFCCSLLS